MQRFAVHNGALEARFKFARLRDPSHQDSDEINCGETALAVQHPYEHS